ncbi:hypothetical protein DVG78_17340 [Runella aurantiaca]|uniref:Uncharacterized protein n=1 Tax=Runella aurantiaca TaxID=2282308 RepID=A0A369IB13_9BACT|nr:hypothetical protein DVG78_17340 [Runella aurantiaca]
MCIYAASVPEISLTKIAENFIFSRKKRIILFLKINLKWQNDKKVKTLAVKQIDRRDAHESSLSQRVAGKEENRHGDNYPKRGKKKLNWRG